MMMLITIFLALFAGQGAAFQVNRVALRVKQVSLHQGSSHVVSRLRNEKPLFHGLRMSTVATPKAPVKSALKIIIAGAPAAGKGTQCEVIKSEFGVVHLSTGDILRAAVKEGTELGVKAKGYMDSGQLVPDELITNVVCDRLKQPDCKSMGWLLDGFPRTRAQADALNQAGFKPDSFILLDVPEDILVDRVTGRRTDPVTGDIYHMTYKPPPADIVPRLVQRSDDTKEKIVVRYREFLKHVDAVKDCYEDKCLKVDGSQSSSAVSGAITAALGETCAKLNTRRKNAEMLGMAATVAALVGTEKAMSLLFKASRVSFPASLGGMILLFSSLQGIYIACPPGSDLLAKIAAPTVALTKAWLPLLFAPPLVVLPLRRKLLGGPRQTAILASCVVVGLLSSLISTGVVAENLRRLETSIRTGSFFKASGKQAGVGGEKPKTGPFANYVDLTPAELSLPLPALSTPKVPTALAAVVLANAVYLARFAATGSPANPGLNPAAMQTLMKIYGFYATVAAYLTASTVLPPLLPAGLRAVAHPVLGTAALTYGAHAVAALATGLPLNGLLSAYYGSGSAVSGAGDLIGSLLGPAIVGFGLQLYTYRQILLQNRIRVVGSTFLGAVFGLSSSALLARVANIQPASTALSLLTRCITTPLALSGAALTGADASLTALTVVMTGLLGASVGSGILDVILPLLGRKKAVDSDSDATAGPNAGPAADAISSGLAIGAAAHGLGSAAVAREPLKFAAAIVSMCLTGVWTVGLLAVPAVRTGLVKVATGGVF